MKVLVIGADKGLGALLPGVLKEGGHQVAAGYYNLEGYSGEANDDILRLQMDVTDEAQLVKAADRLKEKFKELDAVIDVAGILLNEDREKNLLEQSVESIRAHMDVNALGLVLAFRTFLPVMAKGSRFFAVTSEGGSFTLAGTLFPAYSVSKTAANKFVQVIRLTLEEQGNTDVDLIAVHPGRMNTEMGRTTANMEPIDSAYGFRDLVEGKTKVDSSKNWFIDYKGNPMPV